MGLRFKYRDTVLDSERMSKGGFKRIVVAFDGSPDSVRAVKTACSIARGYDAKLTIVHVYSVPAISYATPAPIPQIDAGLLEESAREAGSKTLAKAKGLAAEAGVDAKFQLLESQSVVRAVLEFAEKEACDLIVVGTRGMTGFRRMILGSVSSGLVSHAHCPVLVVR